jgi:hypothetical protein
MARRASCIAYSTADKSLGRSDVALKDMDSARAAFANLKTVRNMSPGVLRLWNLYAETIAQ